ncbi:MAG: maleylpyruvate isomerase N-terminal domain-containing protein, partial [Actinomycetota bacterium]
MSTARCHTRTQSEYCDILEDEIASLVSTVESVDTTTAITTCPGWTLKDLLEHVGGVHRWAANQVRVLTPTRIPSSTIDLGTPSDPTKLAAWLGSSDVSEVLRAADGDAPMWAWGDDKHARFWPRRMV